jgi:hypothetical protein
MWIKEPNKNLKDQESSISKLNFLFNEAKFYIMDNHLAAAWCWLQKLDVNSHYNFFHIDQHKDLLCNAPIESYDSIKENPRLSLDEFLSLKYISCGRDQKAFTYDNYIIQTKQLYPFWFDVCYFACPEYVTDDDYLNIENNPTCYELSTNISYWVHDGKEENAWSPAPEKLNKWILNIDIDYFFSEDKYQMFTDDYIKELCLDILKRIDDIEVITIALSPECCGGWEKSYRLAKLMADSLGFEFKIDELE